MDELVLCEYCECEQKYKLNIVKKTSILKDEEISYMGNEAVCKNCGNEIFVSHVCSENLKSLYEEYRKKNNIIKINQINDIIIRYCISEEALDLLLGWEEATISRYLDGDMPTDNHSDLLKKIYEYPRYYLTILQSNKDRIKIIDYYKSIKSVRIFLDNCIVEEKIDSVIKYCLERCEDITLNSLQKLLYYVQAACYMFTDEFLFNEDCRAFIEGPAYKSVHERYERFGFYEVNEQLMNKKKLVLNDYEKNIVESVIKFYGCYSGKILKQMVQNESPWILSRPRNIDMNVCINKDFKIIKKNVIGQYFKAIKQKYDMENLMDLDRYVKDSFSKVSM